MAVVGDGGGDDNEEWRGDDKRHEVVEYVVELLYCIGYVVEYWVVTHRTKHIYLYSNEITHRTTVTKHCSLKQN